jgi:hypothetical protein
LLPQSVKTACSRCTPRERLPAGVMCDVPGVSRSVLIGKSKATRSRCARVLDPDKSNRDTMKDLQDSIKDRRSLALAESREDAAIVLVVMGWETAQVSAGLFGDPARDRIIRVKFQFGDFQTEMTASAQGGTLGNGGAWGKAAGKIVKQVDEWVRANGAKLGVSGQ